MTKRGPTGARGWSAGIPSGSTDPARAAEVAKLVDKEFENSSAETKTEPEGAFVQGLVNQIGNIALITMSILAAVFFTILLVTGNTMAQAVRERTGELGVLKAIGFTSRQVLGLVLARVVPAGGDRGSLGLGLAWLIAAGGDPTDGMLPMFLLSDAGSADRASASASLLGVGDRDLPRAAGHAPASRGCAAENVT